MSQPSVPQNASSPTVVFVATDHLVALDLVGPMEVFSIANRHPLITNHKRYRLRLVSEHGGFVTAQSGLQIATEGFETLGDQAIDTLIVPGAAAHGAPEIAANLRKWLAQQGQTARRLCSVCTGASFLVALDC